MDAVIESKPKSFNRKAEITKTTELIRELTKAEESLNQQRYNLSAERSRLYDEIDKSKHRMLTDLIIDLRNEICRLEIFPCIPYRKPTLGRSLPFPTDKELAEPIQRTKIQFKHKNKNLATERKMVKELQEHERESHEQLQIKADFAREEANLQEQAAKNKPQPSRYHRPKPLPKSSLKSLIVMWAEKIEDASSLVIRDSKNVAPTRKSYKHLQDLKETSKQFYSQSNIDKEKFAKHWNSMRETRNSFMQIEFDLMKERRRHAEGYAETQLLSEKSGELNKRLCVMYEESTKIWREKYVAREYLFKLQKKQT